MGNLSTKKNILATTKMEMHSVKNGNGIAFLSRVISIIGAVAALFTSNSFPFLESILYIAIPHTFSKREC